VSALAPIICVQSTQKNVERLSSRQVSALFFTLSVEIMGANVERLSSRQVSALKARPQRVYECVQIYYKFEDSGIPENYDVERLSSR
jgi:hypothetical protein